MNPLVAVLPAAVWSREASAGAAVRRPRVTPVAGLDRGEVPVDDLRLIRGTLHGRRDDFGVLVERYQKPLYAFVVRYLGDADAAEDLVQTTFLRAYAALRTFRGDASFKTWLHQIALNECRSRERKAGRSAEVPLEEVGEHVLPSDEPDLSIGLDARGLAPLIERLPPRQKRVLLLRVFSDLPFKEIAHIERTSPGSAKVSYHHAVKRLKEWMS